MHVQVPEPKPRPLDSLERLDAHWTPPGGKRPGQPRRSGHHRAGADRPSGSAGGELFRALLIPGFSTFSRFPVLGVLLIVIGVLFPLFIAGWMLLERDNVLGLVLDDRFLLAIIVGSVAGVLARFVAVTEVAIARQRVQSVGFQTFAAYVALAAIALPVGFGVLRAEQTRSFLDDIFAGSNWSEPLYVPPGGGVPGVNTVLLLGSDGGPDRFGDRVDSIILVSIHQASGRTSLVSVPRNLTRLRFPPGTTMAERFPDGFGDLANSIYPYVQNNADVALDFDIGGLSPPAVAMAQSIGYSLDTRIDDYVFVDMFGFLEVVDALGGVTLELDTVVPLPPNIEGAKRPIPTEIGPGRVDLDGTLAIAYARSRYADSDYGRMERQRYLLSALASQTSTAEALVRLPSVADAMDDMVSTSMARDDFARLVRALGSGTAVVESVGLAPPLVRPGNPDYVQIAGIVRETQQAIASGVPSRFAVVPEG
ncbi:MAG: LytR family transcriptional regulator [Ilumatobacter sp.]|nr:MAG: LytR family transcriptional regulator [Ilumatobacter sp.]